MQEMTTCGDVTHNDVSHTVSTLFHTLVFIFFHSDRNTNYLCLAINLVPELEDCRLISKKLVSLIEATVMSMVPTVSLQSRSCC